MALRQPTPAQLEQYTAWLVSAKALAPEVCQWIGLYFKASFYLGEDSTDLVLGPFIGAPSPHVRIPLNRGICGLALTEERTVNVANVKTDPRYLACSLETKSELVIPLKNAEGEFIAELDIDAHTLDAFTPEITERFERHCQTFSQIA